VKRFIKEARERQRQRVKKFLQGEEENEKKDQNSIDDYNGDNILGVSFHFTPPERPSFNAIKAAEVSIILFWLGGS